MNKKNRSGRRCVLEVTLIALLCSVTAGGSGEGF